MIRFVQTDLYERPAAHVRLFGFVVVVVSVQRTQVVSEGNPSLVVCLYASSFLVECVVDLCTYVDRTMFTTFYKNCDPFKWTTTTSDANFNLFRLEMESPSSHYLPMETDKRAGTPIPFVYWFGLQNLRRYNVCCRAIKTKVTEVTLIAYQCPLFAPFAFRCRKIEIFVCSSELVSRCHVVLSVNSLCCCCYLWWRWR